VETLFYPAMLHSSSRIFIQTHYILWKHPMHWGGVKPQSPTQSGRQFRILNVNFREYLFHVLG
jgi:hypothetical protein